MKRRNDKGITLIALIITIIIMLILAGVVINLVIGKNGLINIAKQAGKNYTNAEDEEQRKLEELYSSILVATNGDSQITISMEDLTTLIDRKVEQKIKTMNVGTVPAGTVISYMGNNIPGGYLSCDGSVYNISEYSNLAEQIKKEFGSYNYFGGDGEKTFAVPDLRGEFLRGTGTNSHSNQGSGTDVGKHQDGTLHIGVTSARNNWIMLGTPRGSTKDEATDTDTHQYGLCSYASTSAVSNSATVYQASYTSRPTNTSVLYCIKY